MYERQAIKEVEYKGYRISLYPDHNPDDPRNWDNFGSQRAWMGSYDLSDHNLDDFASIGEADYDLRQPDEFDEWAARMEAAGELVAVYARVMDYGGGSPLVLRLGYNISNHNIVAYATREQILKEFGGSKLTEAKREKARRLLTAQLSTFGAYIGDEVVGYEIETLDEARPPYNESVWGYYPDGKGHAPGQYDFQEFDYLIDECKAAIDYHLEHNYSQLRLPA